MKLLKNLARLFQKQDTTSPVKVRTPDFDYHHKPSDFDGSKLTGEDSEELYRI